MQRTTRLAIALLCLGLLSILATQQAAADVRLPAVFGDHMVLQQGVRVPVWGWADAGEKVTVALCGQKQAATADSGGAWRLALEPLQAGGPVTMTVAGKNTLTLGDVLVGEVWVCSGQSNMQMAVRASRNAQQEIAAANFPKIRLLTVARATADEPRTDCKAAWVACSPETVPNFSAAGYFFGRHLHQKRGVPVGLINSSWGGTRAEAWTSADTLKADPDYKVFYERDAQALSGYAKALDNWAKTKDAKLARWKAAADKAKAAGKRPPRKPRAPGDPKASPHRPSVLYNGMIAPIVPYPIAGAIWYQGESNAGRAYQYRKLFPDMIKDWRRHWGEGDFPFLFVQLANFMARKPEPEESAWAELREAQSMALALPKTGQAVIIDIGEGGNIHPKNKQDVGKRLALAARAIAYGENIVYSGPVYDAAKVEGSTIRLTFKHTGGGLVAKGGGKLTGFAIAGDDRKFVWADARIDGQTIVVTSQTVPKPVAVRYAWANNPECNLTNAEGLPASPFRTDTWPGVTVNNK